MSRLSSSSKLAYRYIAIMDILGFRDVLQAHTILEVVQNVERVFSATRHFRCSAWVSAKHGQRWISWSGNVKHRSALFSDTIIVWTSGITGSRPERDRIKKETFFRNITDFIFHSFINGIPLRVGIAFGECYIHKTRNIFIGQPIVDAHPAEMAQEWVGGALHPSCLLDGISGWGLVSPVVEYQVPVKESYGLSLRYALDWTTLPDSPEKSKHNPRTREELIGHPTYADEMLKQEFARYSQMSLPESVRKKYANAEVFAQKQMERRGLFCPLPDRDLSKQIK